MYYSYWRHLRLSGILSRMAMIALPPMIFLALFTSVRSSAEHERTATEHIQEITRGGDVVRGMIGLLNGQYAGSISMFLIENYPENYEYRHLESITYFFMLPIPRRWWEGKPIPLSMEVARQARLSKVDWNRLKLGPGIIGHAAAEGGWYALIIYAIVAGLYFRFFDEVVRLNINSPFVVLAVGSAMGQYLGLPRGSVPNFAFIAVMTVTGALLIMIVLSKLVEKFSPSPEFAVDDEDQWETYEAWDEAADRP
jgi:hypothetical protein